MIHLISGENMNQKLYSILILVIFSLILFNSVSAFIVYLRPPKMIIRMNTSDTVERELTIENRNNVTIEINTTMNGNLTEVITFKNPMFEILPNETKTIDFMTKSDKPGVYSGQIIVTYMTGFVKPVTVPSDLTVVVTKSPNKELDTTTVLIVVLIIGVVIVTLFFKNKRWKKR